MSMRVLVNGREMDVADDETVGRLLERVGADPEHSAVMVNEDIVPKNQHDSHTLAAGDTVEILTFVAGG